MTPDQVIMYNIVVAFPYLIAELMLFHQKRNFIES